MKENRKTQLKLFSIFVKDIAVLLFRKTLRRITKLFTETIRGDLLK